MNRKNNKYLQNRRVQQSENAVNYSHIAVSSLVTLIITILAGVVVFYLTSKPAPKPKLYYEIVPPTSFTTDKIQTVIQSFRVWNGGNKEAEDVKISIVIPDDSEIADKKIETSGGATIDVQITQIDEHTLLTKIPLINPNESVSFAFLLNNTSKEILEVDVRGKGLVGELRSSVTTEPEESEDITLRDEPLLFIFMLGLVGIQLFLLYYLQRRGFLKKLSLRAKTGGVSLNNLGFRLIHIGQIEKAKYYLNLALEKEPGVYPLGNLAHAYALDGNYDDAISIWKVAEEYVHNNKSAAFLDYCSFCIHLLSENKAEALASLREALQKDKDTILEYYNWNTNIQNWKEDNDILVVLESFQ